MRCLRNLVYRLKTQKKINILWQKNQMCIRDSVTALRTITSGRATSSMTYDHHAQVSSSIAKAVLEEVKGRRQGCSHRPAGSAARPP